MRRRIRTRTVSRPDLRGPPPRAVATAAAIETEAAAIKGANTAGAAKAAAVRGHRRRRVRAVPTLLGRLQHTTGLFLQVPRQDRELAMPRLRLVFFFF